MASSEQQSAEPAAASGSPQRDGMLDPGGFPSDPVNPVGLCAMLTPATALAATDAGGPVWLTADAVVVPKRLIGPLIALWNALGPPSDSNVAFRRKCALIELMRCAAADVAPRS